MPRRGRFNDALDTFNDAFTDAPLQGSTTRAQDPEGDPKGPAGELDALLRAALPAGGFADPRLSATRRGRRGRWRGPRTGPHVSALQRRCRSEAEREAKDRRKDAAGLVAPRLAPLQAESI